MLQDIQASKTIKEDMRELLLPPTVVSQRNLRTALREPLLRRLLWEVTKLQMLITKAERKVLLKACRASLPAWLE